MVSHATQTEDSLRPPQVAFVNAMDELMSVHSFFTGGANRPEEQNYQGGLTVSAAREAGIALPPIHQTDELVTSHANLVQGPVRRWGNKIGEQKKTSFSNIRPAGVRPFIPPGQAAVILPAAVPGVGVGNGGGSAGRRY